MSVSTVTEGPLGIYSREQFKTLSSGNLLEKNLNFSGARNAASTTTSCSSSSSSIGLRVHYVNKPPPCHILITFLSFPAAWLVLHLPPLIIFAASKRPASLPSSCQPRCPLPFLPASMADVSDRDKDFRPLCTLALINSKHAHYMWSLKRLVKEDLLREGAWGHHVLSLIVRIQ